MTEKEFAQAVEKNNRRVFLIALSYTKNREDAEDIMQNVFLKLWQYKKVFESEEHIGKWLTVVTVNESKNFLRRHIMRSASVEIDAGECFAFDCDEDRELFDTVMSLPPKLSSVIHLFYYEDMSVKEIAKVLSVSESTVKTRLNRGREKLKNVLGGEWKNE